MTEYIYTVAPKEADFEFVEQVEEFVAPLVKGGPEYTWRKMAFVPPDKYGRLERSWLFTNQCQRYNSASLVLCSADDPRVVPLEEMRTLSLVRREVGDGD